MVSFKYELGKDSLELQASDWSGLERVYINGQMVSRKLNFSHQSEHLIKLKDGGQCLCKLFIDPFTNELTCRTRVITGVKFSVTFYATPTVNNRKKHNKTYGLDDSLFILFKSLIK